MKTQLSKLLIFSLFVIALGSCKKDTEMPTGEFVNLETHEAGTITAISAVVDAKAKASCTERGVCWGKAPNPTLDDFHIAKGKGKGEYSCTLTDLEPNQKYYYRAYATDGKRYVYATDEKNFTTRDGVAKVTTGSVTNITTTSGECAGEVTDDGGCPVTERGFCWSTTPNPTFENNAQHVSAGSGVGEFSATLNGLEESTLYYVCAYTTNSYGTCYGEDVTLSTFSTRPITFTANGVSFKMIFVESDTFWIGAQCTNPNGQNYDSEAWTIESPIHQVTMSDFYIGETEVRQALWQAVMGSNPSHFSGSNLPVEQVSWNDCQQFITKLNQLCASQLNGRQFALPTEAQWEYAARGGKQSQGYKYSGSNTLDDVAWWKGNSGSNTHAVSTKQANELGLYDMSGNVWEWCSDWYGDYDSSAQTDPTGPASGSYRVSRGGCWNGSAWYCRVPHRYYCTPGPTFRTLGLRLALCL